VWCVVLWCGGVVGREEMGVGGKII